MAWPFNRKRDAAPERVEPAAPQKPRRQFEPRARARMYEAASVDRLTAKWGTQPLEADEIVRRHQRALVARSREQCANNAYARGFLRMCRQNIVGASGVQLQAQPRGRDNAIDRPAADAIERAWREWSRPVNCDVAGRLSLREITAQMVTSAARDGEAFAILVEGRDAGPWGMALQVIDAQRCPVDHDEDLAGGAFIRHGVEFNRYGRPVAYHFTTTRAEDEAYRVGGRTFERIPADRVFHLFRVDMVGQKRGIPWTATALSRLHMLGGFENAALVNARLGASKAGFFTWREGYGPEDEEDREPLTMSAEPGTFEELPAGAEFQEWNPAYPSGELAPFNKAMLRGIATGLGAAYNTLANDLEGVNFSSIRHGALEERERWKDDQEWLIEGFLDPLYRRWIARQLLAGRITVGPTPLRADRLEKYLDVSWQPRRWAWVDPQKEVAAAVAAKNNFLTPPSQIIREQGRDPDTVWRSIAADIAAMQAAGIPPEWIQIAMGMQIPAQDDRQDVPLTEEDESAPDGATQEGAENA